MCVRMMFKLLNQLLGPASYRDAGSNPARLESASSAASWEKCPWSLLMDLTMHDSARGWAHMFVL